MFQSFRRHARQLSRQTYALYLAYRDPRTPWYAKAFAALVVAYALSPIDLIPDFVPVLGYLDDLIIVPVGIYLSVKLIPAEVMLQAKEAANASSWSMTTSRAGLAIVATIWVVCVGLGVLIIYRLIGR